MPDFLSEVAASTRSLISQGYYSLTKSPSKRRHIDLKASIARTKSSNVTPVIAELKPKSPSLGSINPEANPGLAPVLEKAGACAISVLVEPRYFGGSLSLLSASASSVSVPVLFKDFVVSKKQIEAASEAGADLLLMIAELFEIGACDTSLEKMVDYAKDMGLQVLLEFHDINLVRTVLESSADYVGVNNRDLHNLTLDPAYFERVSEHLRDGRIIVAESGYTSREQILKHASLGADAFLIGSSIMASQNPAEKLRELAHGHPD
ncbi:MAG: indole-3-glycerol-phosphate synthase [Thermoprotei archaeon]